MDSMIAKLRVALQMDSAAFESGAARSASQVNALGINMGAARSRMASFSEGLIVSGQRAQQMGTQMRAVNDNAGAMRAGLQSAGFQLQDMAVQFASGQRAGTIFAQQLPQLSSSISQMAAAAGATSGLLGRFAGFMAGPWGVAVGVGTAVLAPLIARLFDTGAAAQEGAKGIYTLGDALSKLKSAPMEAIGRAQEKVLLAQGKINNARNMAIPQGTSEASRASQLIAQQNRDRAISTAQFELETANRELGILRMVQSKQDELARTAAPVSTAFRSGRSSSGGGSARSAGQAAGREYRSGAEDELRKLQQTTNEIMAQLKPYGDRTTEQFARRDKGSTEAIRAELADMSNIVGYTGKQIEDSNRKAGESFEQMTDRALGSLRELANGIQGGDFLGILGGLFNVLKDLGSMGLFGSGIKANVAAFRTSPRADGGPVSAGRMYMVGERGPELFSPNGSGTITPNHRFGGGGSVVYQFSGNLLTPEFWSQINAGHAVAAQAGGEIGYRKVTRAGSRRLA